MAPLKYPIGTQSFETIRMGGYTYADKTRYIYDLISSGARQVFLGRPRRFGKSLLLSTLQAYFEGRRELFDGLALGELETEWKSYPVLHFSFGSMATNDPIVLERFVNNRLNEYEEKYAVKINDNEYDAGDRFGMLIKNVAEKTGKKVVVLIDEYDKGIVEFLQEEEKLAKNTAMFRSFYSQLKDRDDYLQFVFVTGVSRFRNLTLFSSPNQLQDISMDVEYAAICGLTSSELDTIFIDGIELLAESEGVAVDAIKHQLKMKYDGYRFTKAKEYVYNPFSILNCLSKKRFSNFWLTSGGASKVFIDFLKNADYDLSDIEQMWVSEETLGGPYSLKEPIPLLFQTGYLTISEEEYDMYRLCIPNGEVRSALVDELVPLYLNIKPDEGQIVSKRIGRLADLGDADGLMKEFQQIISKIPHQHFRFNDVEHLYHLIMTLICQMAGIDARSEVSVAGGDIDMLIETSKFVYLLEFKKDHSPEDALRQIDTKNYALSWTQDNRKLIKIGVEFSSATRNISNWIIA